MAIEINKKEKESSQNLVRRFSKRLKQSGLLLRVRKRTFRQRKKSSPLRKKRALRREEKKKDYQRKEKMGMNIRK